MLKVNFLLSAGISVLCTFCLHSQTMSLEDAVKMGLDNNLGLQVAESNLQIAEINTHPGAAGMLPTVTAEGNLNYSLNNANQEFLDGRVNEITGGSDINSGVSVRLDWTIFDGLAMYARRDQSIANAELSSIMLERQALQLSTDISIAYQGMVAQLKIKNALDENAEYLRELAELTEKQLEIGSGTRLDVLQAKTDLNELLNQLEMAELQYEIFMANLNLLLQNDADNSFRVDTAFVGQNVDITYGEWASNALENNYNIKSSEKNLEIQKYNEKIARSELYPQVDLNAGVEYGFLRSNFGFLLSNEAYGPFIGISARYNLFDGKRVKRNIEVSEIESEVASLELRSTKINETNSLYSQYLNYKYYNEQVKRELDNLKLAEENFELADKMYRQGRINQYELRQVRVQKLAIDQRLIQARYQKAIAYLSLMNISGQSWL